MLQPAETVRIFQTSVEAQSFSPGEIIFKEGDKGEVMYGILEGEIEMLVHNKILETLKEGDVFGEGSLIHEDHLRASTARAKTDCKLVFLDKEHFLFAVQQTPMFALEVMRSYSDRFRRLKRLI